MGLKQFLKPDQRKILVTIVLGGIIFLLTKLFMATDIQFTFFVNILNTQLAYPVIAMDILYWYILSCLIFLVNTKYKKGPVRIKRTFVKRREIRIVNWKEFLKPSKMKVILTIILLIIGWLRYFISNAFFYWLSVVISFPLIIFNLAGPYLSQILDVAVSTKSLPIVLLILIIAATIFITYFYLLSCLIVWVYNKKIKTSVKYK